MAKLLYQGHGSYRIVTADNVVIYIDPFAGEGYDLEADFILITHEHSDHNKTDLVHLKPDGKIYRPKNMLVAGNYNQISEKKITALAVPAYNKFHSRKDCIGYVLELDGKKIYAAGDTSKTDYMETILSKENLDYAILPTDGFFNMGINEAIKCAELIGAKHTIPIHMKPGALFDEKKAKKFQTDSRLIVHPAEEIEL